MKKEDFIKKLLRHKGMRVNTSMGPGVAIQYHPSIGKVAVDFGKGLPWWHLDLDDVFYHTSQTDLNGLYDDLSLRVGERTRLVF